MEEVYIQKQTFEKVNANKDPLAKGDYDLCTFNNCDLSYADLGGINFTDCIFTGCHLSMVKLNRTGLSGIKFTDCKMLGIHFKNSNQLTLSIHTDNCTLDHCSFYQVKMKKMTFKNCRLFEADFTDCDLSGAVLDNCDLTGAKFERTILEKTDLRTAFNYSIDPEQNKIKKARFSQSGIAGLLDKYDIEIED